MKTAVFSDIHANPHALRMAINSAKRLGCKHMICCGDIVGYGYAPNDCIEICKRYNIECIKGNHDAALIGELSLDWFNSIAMDGVLANRPLVSAENRRWLANLPFAIKKQFGETKVVFSHGTYAFPERFNYIDDAYSAKVEMDAIRKDGIDVLFIGHTHGAEMYARYTSDDSNLTHGELPRAKSRRFVCRFDGYSEAIFNVGSVGYPRRCLYSTYAIIDDEKMWVEWRRLPFDYEGYIHELEKMGREIPVWLQARLVFLKGDEE